jgi:very-short-patch-repair endonuclease
MVFRYQRIHRGPTGSNRINKCVICGAPTARHLCRPHMKAYTFDKEYGVYRLKPKCQVSKHQEALYKTIRSIYRKDIFQEVSFEWCPYRRFDIVAMDKKLIFEYDGEQHYKFVKLWHKSRQGFVEYLKDAEEKQKVAERQGYKVIHFSYREDVEDREYVIKKLRLKGAL